MSDKLGALNCYSAYLKKTLTILTENTLNLQHGT